MKKILASIFIIACGLCFVGCEVFIEYASLSSITKDEEFTSAYVSSVNGDEQVIVVDFNDLKEQNFFKNIMNSSAKPTDVLPEVIPRYNLIISSNNNSFQIADMNDLYANYKEKWYLIKSTKEDKLLLLNYLLGTNEIMPNDPLQIIRNDDGKIILSVIALTGGSCEIKYKDLNENKIIDVNNKNELFNFLVEKIQYGRKSVYDYTNCSMDYIIEITYDIYNNPKETSNTYEFKFHSDCGSMTILKNGDLIGTIKLSIDETNALLKCLKIKHEKTFDELFGYTVDSATKIIIDQGPGSITPPWIHSVYEVNDDVKINVLLEYLKNAKLTKTEFMPGLGTKEITIITDDKEYKLSFTSRNELWCNGQVYACDIAFPKLNENLIYQYYESYANVMISINGQETKLPNNYFEDIKFLPYSIKPNSTFATKFGTITIDGVTLMLTSKNTFTDLLGGTYTIVGDKDFSELLEGVNTETARVYVDSYTIIVSKNVEYTVAELKNALFGFEYEPYTLVKEDGSVFDTLLITEDITLIFRR